MKRTSPRRVTPAPRTGSPGTGAREQFLGLKRMGSTSTDNLLTAITTAKEQPLSRVPCALGVRGTGRSMSRRIARYFATMDNIRDADAEAMRQVEDIGTEKAPSIVAELAELAPLIDKLAAAGVNMSEPGATPPTPASDGPDSSMEKEATGGPLAGMTMVVTGAMTGVLKKLRGCFSTRSVDDVAGGGRWTERLTDGDVAHV